jgi:lipopolysaccharide/colanic/teichoic acid biosynthesis glycosyltransferase
VTTHPTTGASPWRVPSSSASVIGGATGVCAGVLALADGTAAVTVAGTSAMTLAGAVGAVLVTGDVPAGPMGHWERALRAATAVAALVGVATSTRVLADLPLNAPRVSAAAALCAFAVGALAAVCPRGRHTAALGELPPACAAFKRSIDVVGSTAGLVLAAPVIAVAAAAISVESRGGWLYRQMRVGQRGRPIRIYKLRTMIAGNDDDRHRAYVASLIRGEASPRDGVFKLVDDPRRTRVGRVLRRYSIDELPQLWNVLRGDMSLVGPRAPLAHEVELYDERAHLRLTPKPGLTGLWQVSGRSRLSFDEMVDLDVRYAREWTPLLDLRILLRTPAAVFSGDGTA